MTRVTRLARALVAALVGTVLLAGCDFDVYALPLPGGADVGNDPITIHATFADVLDLVPKSAVKVNDVSVGRVTDIKLDGYRADVTMELRNDTKLPDNAIAEIRQTSLLGEKFVSLEPPSSGAEGTLKSGDTIPIERTGRNPEVEEVLSALSLILNGGGVAQLKTIAQELNKATTGREDDIRSVLDQVNTFATTLDDSKADIVNAIEKLNQLSISVRQQQGNIDLALEQLPSALTSIDKQRKDLVTMLQALDQLSSTGVRVIQASKDATIDAVRQLQPVLSQLADSGDAFVKAFNVFLTYPFVDEVVGRDPQVARNLHVGDYTNLSINLELDLTKGLPTIGIPTDLVCTPLAQIPPLGPLPPLDQLCAGAIDAINKCLAAPSVENCRGLPDFLIKQVCSTVAVPLLCPGAPSATPSLPLPSISLPGITLPPLLGTSASPGLINGLLGGSGRAAPWTWKPAAEGGPTMAQLETAYDPALVSLLVPAMASAAGDLAAAKSTTTGTAAKSAATSSAKSPAKSPAKSTAKTTTGGTR